MVTVNARLGKEAHMCIIHCFTFSLCSRGEVCSHVASLLFKVEAACRLGYNRPTCTSLPCAWNQSFSTKVRLHKIF